MSIGADTPLDGWCGPFVSPSRLWLVRAVMKPVAQTQTEGARADETKNETPTTGSTPQGANQSVEAGHAGVKSAQPSPAIKAPAKGLSPEMLAKLGITDQRLADARAGKFDRATNHTLVHRLVHMNAIRENVDAILEDHKPAEYFSAAALLEWLIEHGFGRTAKGRPLRGANAIGDAAGTEGLMLPFVDRGKKRYAIKFANASAEEKAEVQEALNNLTEEQLKALPIA